MQGRAVARVGNLPSQAIIRRADVTILVRFPCGFCPIPIILNLGPDFSPDADLMANDGSEIGEWRRKFTLLRESGHVTKF